MRRNQPGTQSAGGTQCDLRVRGISGHVIGWNRTTIEDETDVVGVRIVRALFDQAHALTRPCEIALIDGVQVSREEQPDPEPTRPVTMAPAGCAITVPPRCRIGF